MQYCSRLFLFSFLWEGVGWAVFQCVTALFVCDRVFGFNIVTFRDKKPKGESEETGATGAGDKDGR